MKLDLYAIIHFPLAYAFTCSLELNSRMLLYFCWLYSVYKMNRAHILSYSIIFSFMLLCL